MIAGLVLDATVTDGYRHDHEMFEKGWWFAPAIALGLLGGRRLWPHFVFAAVIVAVPIIAFHGLFPASVALIAIPILGYGGLLVRSVVTGCRWLRPLKREADHPRSPGGGGPSSGGRPWERPASVTSSTKPGGGMRRRPY